jgi:hypothetical protein
VISATAHGFTWCRVDRPTRSHRAIEFEQIYDRPVSARDTVTVVRFSQILDNPTG